MRIWTTSSLICQRSCARLAVIAVACATQAQGRAAAVFDAGVESQSVKLTIKAPDSVRDTALAAQAERGHDWQAEAAGRQLQEEGLGAALCCASVSRMHASLLDML